MSRRFTLYLLVAAVLLLRPDQARSMLPNGWEVVESSTERLVLRIVIPDATLETVEIEGVRYIAPQLEGYWSFGEPGLPLLPQRGAWIGIPPSGDCRLTARVLSTRALDSGRILPHATPMDAPPDSREALESVHEHTVEADGYASFRIGRGELARLGSPVWSRKQRLQAITVQPFLVEGAGARFEQVEELEIVIDFPATKLFDPAPGQPDPLTLARVLNPEASAMWRAYSPQQRRLVEESSPLESSSRSSKSADLILPLDEVQLLSDEYRIPVAATGPVRLHMADLFGALGFPGGIRRDQLRLYQKRPSEPGSPEFPSPLSLDVPFHFLGNPDPAGDVSASDILLFYGFGVQEDNRPRDVGGAIFPAAMGERAENFNSYNIYWLAGADPAGGSWARMPVENFAAAAGTPRDYYDYEESFGEDVWYQPNAVAIEETRYLWNSPYQVEGKLPLRLRPLDPTSPLDVEWTFCSNIHTRQAATLETSFYLENDDGSNRTLLGTYDINGGSGQFNPGPFGRPSMVSSTVPAGSFAEGSLKLRFHNVNEASTLFHFVMVDSLTLRYRARYQADFDRAVFSTGVVGTSASLVIPDFSSTQIFAFENTDPRSPRWVELSSQNMVDADGRRSLSFEVLPEGAVARSFVAMASVGIPRVPLDRISRSEVPILTASLSPLQAMVIGPQEFDSAMQTWLQWRRDHDRAGRNYGYVDVQSIFDQFSGGLSSPEAIKEFCLYGYTLWDTEVVMLVGDANEDHRRVMRVANQVAGTRDYVPSSEHLQYYTDFEVLASDKWYGLFDIEEASYPRLLDKGPDLLIGRWPVRTAAEAASLTAKVMAYEQPTLSDTWRQTTLWVDDDAFSTGYLGNPGGGSYLYSSQEAGFQTTQETSSAQTSAFLDGVMLGETWNLDFWTAPVRGPGTVFPVSMLNVVQQEVVSSIRPQFFATMQQGAFLLNYQGHANYNVMAHETLFVQEGGQPSSVNGIGNNGKPFLFFGMGCHISDFIRPTELAANDSRSLGELFMVHPTGGAIATYGSSGFEFLTPNLAFGEVITDVFFGPTRSGQVLDSTAPQWILGDVMAQAEWDVFAAPTILIPQMVSQYTLLGDPLLRMDGAAPRVAANGDGVDIADRADVLPLSGNGAISLVVDAVDESGVDRVELIQIVDGQETDLSALLIPQTGPGLDVRSWQLNGDLPVRAQGLDGGTDYELRVFDLAYPDMRPGVLSFRVPFELMVIIDDSELGPEGRLVPVGQNSSFELNFTSPITLTDQEIEVELTGLMLEGALDKSMQDAEGRQWSVSFNATGEASEEQSILLRLAGSETTIPLAGQVAGEPLSIKAHFPVPSPANPERSDIRIVVDLTVPTSSSARVTVYDLTGRPVKSWSEEGLSGQNPLVLTWDGRDRRGDSLANGTYLYRLEVDGEDGSSHSAEMGRVVIMR